MSHSSREKWIRCGEYVFVYVYAYLMSTHGVCLGLCQQVSACMPSAFFSIQGALTL